MGASDDVVRLVPMPKPSIGASSRLKAASWSSSMPPLAEVTAPELAAVVSALVFEARRDGPSEPRVPAGPVTATSWASP